MSRGIVAAQTLRSEQFEFEARTSDPSNTQPGEYWIRTDQTGSNPDKIAELRRQDNSGVTTCPIFASAEESNLGADVVRGPSVVLDGGSVGFVAMTTGSGEVGSPRAVNSAGTEFVSHNALELNAIPDSATNQYPYESFSASEWTDQIVSKDITTISGLTANGSAFNGSGGVDAEASNNDHGLGSAWNPISGSNIFNDWSIGVSINVDSSDGNGAIVGYIEGSGEWIIAGIGSLSSIGSFANTGKPFLTMRESSGDRYDIVFNTTINDDTNTHVGFSKSGNNGSSAIECYIDGSEITNKTVTNDQGFGDASFPSTFDLGYFATNDLNSGSIADNLTASIHEIVAYNEALTLSEWTDEFERQSWS